MRILLVEDSFDIGELVATGLKPYTVQQARTIAKGDEALGSEAFDLILLDIRLPDGNGLDMCHRLSQDERFCNVPKIILTGMSDPSEIASGFSCGADDYLTKPFSIVELKARIDRFFRDKAEAIIVSGDFQFDLNFQRCFVVQEETKTDLQLTPTEFRIFLFLAKSEGRAISREELENAIWKSHQTFIKTRGIDTHVANLRRKLGDRKDVIVSVYGKGYAFTLGSSRVREKRDVHRD